MIDCFTTPPFFCLAAAPAAALSLDAPDTASPGPLPTPVSRVMFDDVSNDIVVFAGDGAISFFHLRRDDVPTPAASSALDDSGANTGKNGPRGRREGDWGSEITSLTDLVLTLRIKHKPGTCLPSLRVAKRFPSPIAAAVAAASPPSAAAHHRRRAEDTPPPAYLVALSHDERHLFFYQCPGTNRVGPGAAGHVNGTPPMPCPVISAFCKYECRPSNLRYQQDHYQIRFYVWVGQSPPPRPPPPRLSQEGEGDPASALSRPRCGVVDGPCVTRSSSHHRGIARLLCTSSVCIDLLAIEPHPPCCRDGRTGVIVLARYPTHTDTWLYDARTGLLLSVNVLEHPDIVKPFRVGEDQQSIVPGPKLQLPASLPHTTVAVRRNNPRDPRADSTTLGLYVGIVTLYDQPFMYAIRPRSSECALYSYAHPTSPDAEEGEGSYALFAVLSMAEFPCVRYYCAAAAAVSAAGRTSVDATLPTPIPSSSLTAPAILVHTVDNLLLLHAVEDDLISAFDVGLANSDDYHASHRRRQQLFTLEASMNATESSAWTASHREVGRPRPNTLSTAAVSLCHAVSRRVAPGTIGRETPLYEADRLDAQKMQPLRPLATASLRMLSRDGDTPVAEEGDQYCMTSAGWPLVCRCDRERQWAAFRIHLNPFSLLAGLTDTATTARPMHTRTLQVQFLLQRVGCGGEAVPRIVAGLLTGPAAHRMELPAVWTVIVAHHLHQGRTRKTPLPLTSGSLEMEPDGGVSQQSSEQPRLPHHDVLCTSLFSVSPSPSAVALANMASRRSYSQQDIWTLVVEPLWPTPETAPAAALGLFSTVVQLARCLLRCGAPLEPCTAIALLRVVDASALWTDGGTLVEGLSDVLEVAFVASGGRLVVPNECVAEAMLTAYDSVVARGAHPTLRATLFTPAVSMLKQVVGIVRAVQACLVRHQLTPAIALCEEVPSSDSTTGAVAMRAVLTYQLHQLTTHQERGDHAALAAARRSYTWTYARFVRRLPQMGLREFSGPRHVTV